MIMHFSGTGNSRYAAEIIAEKTGDTLFDINAAIKAGSTAPVSTGEDLVIAAPTYAWRLPRAVTEWLSKTPLEGAKKVWFVMTCGSEIGSAGKYNRALCGQKGLEYMGTCQVIMPENYIAMFNAPDTEKAKRIVSAALPGINAAAQLISEGKPFPPNRDNPYDRAMSGLMNGVFYRFALKASPFRSLDSCVGCGLCEKACPLNNIRLENNRPVWGKRCTHCMACICYCPKEAIEYGKKSVGKPRYQIEKVVK